MTISYLLFASKIVTSFYSSNRSKINLMDFWVHTGTETKNIRTFGMFVRLYLCCPMGKVQ